MRGILYLERLETRELLTAGFVDSLSDGLISSSRTSPAPLLPTGSVSVAPVVAHVRNGSLTDAAISLADNNPQKWDQLLLGTWYVPAANMLAYLVTEPGATPVPLADQTIFDITSATDGSFTGQNGAQLSIPSPLGLLQPGPSTFEMNGVVTPDGQIRISFTPYTTSSGQAPVTGVGNMEFIDGAWRMTMQMATGTTPYVIHWAYMTKLAPGDVPPPAAGFTPTGLRSEEWHWLLGTHWALTDSHLFGSSGGSTFQIEGYRNGYFWGSGGGSSGLSVVATVTPEGRLFLVLADGDSVTRTGSLQATATGQWQMTFRSYDGTPAAGTAELLSLLTPNQLFVAHLYDDILEQLPDPVGLAAWTTRIDQGLSRFVTAWLIAQCPEARTVQVEQAYQNLLGRPTRAGWLPGSSS